MNQYRHIRSFDAVFYSFIALVLFLFHDIQAPFSFPSLGVFVITVPAVGIAAATLAIPGDILLQSSLKERIKMLKLFALATAGLAPFVSWHINGAASIYLTLCAGLAFVSGVVYILTLLKILEEIFTLASRPIYALASKHLRSFSSLAVLTPTATLYVFIIINMLQRQTVPAQAFSQIWNSLHPVIQTALPAAAMIYVGLFLWMLFKVRGVMTTLYEGYDSEQNRPLENPITE